MKKAFITTSWDDAHPLDIKLSKILKKYNIPATFYIPINNPEQEIMNENQIKSLSKHFDIGGHTLSHQNLTKLKLDQAFKEILLGKEKLEQIIERKIDVFCYPRGYYNKKIINLVKKAGFIGARTANTLITQSKNVYELGTTVHVTNTGKNHLKHSIKNIDVKLISELLKNNIFNKNWMQIAKYTFNYVFKNGGVFHLWGHSWEIEKCNQWDLLEEFFEDISESKKFSYLNNTDLVKTVGGTN